MSAVLELNVGLCGFGTVGQGVWKHLSANQRELETRLGVKFNLARVAVRDLKRKRTVKVPAARVTDDPLAIANDPSIHIVCELMGGTGVARQVTLAALRHGKIVVSANKALICEHGPEIIATARRHGGHFFFEASVAGGIPIIKAVREGLAANRIEWIAGIINGTTNFILREMRSKGLDFGKIGRAHV